MSRTWGRRPSGVRNIESHALVVLVRAGAELGRWPLVGPWHPDLGMVDDLARSQLAVRRLGCSLELHRARPEIKALLALVGLTTTIPCLDLGRAPLALPAPGERRPVPPGPVDQPAGRRLGSTDEIRPHGSSVVLGNAE